MNINGFYTHLKKNHLQLPLCFTHLIQYWNFESISFQTLNSVHHSHYVHIWIFFLLIYIFIWQSHFESVATIYNHQVSNTFQRSRKTQFLPLSIVCNNIIIRQNDFNCFASQSSNITTVHVCVFCLFCMCVCVCAWMWMYLECAMLRNLWAFSKV